MRKKIPNLLAPDLSNGYERKKMFLSENWQKM